MERNFKKSEAYRRFILIRLAEGEPQAETRLPCLHQQGASNALIDGSEKPLSAARRHTERERESSPTAEHARTHAHTRVQTLRDKNHASGRFLSLKSGAYPTHPGCSGEVAAALSALLRFNSVAHHSSRGGGANKCHSSFQTFGWLRQQVFKAEL